MITLSGCISKDGAEIDGQEFDVEDIEGLIIILQELKKGEGIHLNYVDKPGLFSSIDNELDLWLDLRV